MKRAIVLSGGGAQGAYQIGVWKALRKLHIKYDLVTGTSVGAINGAMMVQKDFYRAIWMWHNLSFNHVFDEKIQNDYFTDDGKKEIMKMYVKNIFLNGGMDASKLEETIQHNLKVNKFYKSKMDYGLITVKLPNFQPITLTKKEIPKEKLKDYIVASATCFPAFKKKQIADSLYVDGGYYDNLPINLAIDMKADEIIAVDLNTIGIKRRIKRTDIKITYISPRNDLGSFLVFHRDLSRRNIKFGYNDTMKIFNKLDGDKYTFKHNNLEKNLKHYQNFIIKELKELFNFPEQSKTVLEKIVKITNYQQIMNGNYDTIKKVINSTIEYAGRVFEIEEADVYDINKYNHLLVDKLNKVDVLNIKLIEQKIKDNDIISLLDTGLIVKYVYSKIVSAQDSIKIKKEVCQLSLILSREFMCALYIFAISKQKSNIYFVIN